MNVGNNWSANGIQTTTGMACINMQESMHYGCVGDAILLNVYLTLCERLCYVSVG